MPRYAITANFDPKEIEKIEKACKLKGCSKYKLLREGTLALSEAIIDEEKENVGGLERGSKENIPRGTEEKPNNPFI